jgi:formate hydrogenlyase subunit 4
MGTGLVGAAAAIGLTLIKALAIAVFVAVLESSIAKYRFFRLPDLLFVSFILSVISIALIL